MLRRPRSDNPFPYTVLTAPQQVAAAIKREILEGALKPGDKLPPEAELARLFSVSRPTVRAGLRELCAAQILVVQRGRNGGYHVGQFGFEALEASVMEFISLSLVVEALKPDQFLEVRVAHELLCAETAARHRVPVGVAKLETIRAEIEEAYDDPRKAFELDLQFHRALAEATGNPLIVSIEGALIAVLHRLIGDAHQTTPLETLGNLADIIDAVRDGDAVAARVRMTEHLSRTAIHYGLDVTAGAARSSSG